ncbi:MAG: flap structure-specific endonuclease, partial [Nitrososphaerota archaeon]|nr:flap structure-specific endonuclease [Nitrososphaerota archaeon]
GFEGVGPATALKYLKKYGRLEEIKELAGPLSEVSYPGIRRLYLEAPANKGVKPEWKTLDKQGVISFLVGEHSFSRDRVEAAISRVQATKPAQSETLEKWFG